MRQYFLICQGPMYQKTLNTILYNPSWWVRAYEVSTLAKTPHLSPMEVSCESGTSPAFSSVELSALAIVISNIQKQLFKGKLKIILDPVEHRKFVSSTAKHRIFAFERILQILTGMQLLTGNKGEGFEVSSLFTEQVWKRQGMYQGLTIEVELADLGPELVLGYVEPYSDLCRYLKKIPRAQRILGGRGPLRLWQSAWLDLQGIEQVLLLRLEKVMQWDQNWLRLDGVFGSTFEDMMQDLEIPKARGKSRDWSPFRIKKRVMDRLGRKLADHGLMNFDLDEGFIPFSPTEDFSVVWQASPEYLNQNSQEEFAAASLEVLRERTFTSNLPSILLVLAGSLYNGKLAEDLGKLWQELGRCEDADYLGIVNNNILISARCLFMEWFIRQMPNHKTPLIEFVRWQHLWELASPHHKEDVIPRFEKFVAQIREDGHDLLQEIEGLSGLSLISPKTQRDPEMFPYFVALGDSLSADFRQPSSSSLRSSSPKPKPEVDIKVANIDSSAKQKKLKAAATAELERLRNQWPEQYENLKKAYIDTLDAEKKKIIMEVKERLQPKIFDDHLKNSLIRFMIEQPDSWISNSSSLHF